MTKNTKHFYIFEDFVASDKFTERDKIAPKVKPDEFNLISMKLGLTSC